MNGRERFLRIMHFEEVDRFPIWDFGFWDETAETWYEQGLPRDVHISKYFGMDRPWEFDKVTVNIGMVPRFDPEILEETEDNQIIIDTDGVKCIRRKKGSSIPKYIEFPVKNRDDFERMKERYNPKSPARYSLDWDEKVKMWKDRDYPLGIFTGGFFGWLRGWMGIENLSLTFYDDPELINDMMDFVRDFVIETITPALEQVEIDYAAFWEDMSCNKGSLLSPRMFKEFMVPRYKKITDHLKKYGIDICIVDSDGYIGELIPLWLEGGVNCMFPIEVRSGNDPLEMRREYGKELLMIGGIDKLALMGDKKMIEEEVMSKVPQLTAEGGYIPTVDHRVPPDIPLENYLYYLKLIKQIAGVE